MFRYGIISPYQDPFTHLPYLWRKWVYGLDETRLDDLGRRLRDMYIAKFRYGFPFVTKMEFCESPDYPSLVLAEEFKQFPSYDIALTEEGAGPAHLTYLLYVRIRAEFKELGLEMPTEV
jgi:hypothetical protein